MTAQVLIEPQTAAVEDIKFVKASINTVPATLIATGLTGKEVIPVYVTPDNGATSVVASQNDIVVELTATNNVISVNTPVHLGVGKPLTASKVGVYLASGTSDV